MTQIPTVPFGSWPSPITSDRIVSDSVGLSEVKLVGDGLYWLERRPQEKGRSVIVKDLGRGQTVDLTPPGFNVRTRVHEYGGGAFLITADETIYFVNDGDRLVYIQKPGESPQTLTDDPQWRFAEFSLDAPRQRLICVAEDHHGDGEPQNYVVAIALATGHITILAQGADFYGSPRLSPDGGTLAWFSWNHPHLPWDQTQLWIAAICADGTLETPTLVAGHEPEAIVEPRWAPDGTLLFSGDRSGWWNLYRHCPQTQETQPLCPLEADFGYPHWIFGESIGGFTEDHQLICAYTEQGAWKLARIDHHHQTPTAIATDYPYIAYVQVQGHTLAFIGGHPQKPTAVVTLDLVTGEEIRVKQSSNLDLDPGYLSQPEAIAFPTANGLTAYGWYYPPTNGDVQGPTGELPPLLVKSHGGPTACAYATLNLRIQYWTSRGFGYFDVNYGGSTGYGREYRQRLRGQWGIVDVADCVHGAQYLAQQHRADGDRLVISGGSAGGYTTLAALTFYDVFKAGASYYGISDLEILAQDTHKFEARYLDGLVGSYPESKALYQERSPLYHTEKLSCPVIFFQGLEDAVVPPNQAEMMVDAIAKKGLPVAYITFAGEQHGFRQAPNIKAALDGEFYFYSQVFGFQPAEDLPPVTIQNLDGPEA